MTARGFASLHSEYIPHNLYISHPKHVPMKKNGLKTTWKILGFCFLAVFFLFNIVAYNHAQKFTRYGEPSPRKRTNLDKLSGIEKVGVVLSGISNPKPQNDSVPHVAYETIKLGIERKLEAWLLKADSSQGTVLAFHGYSGNKSSLVKQSEIIRDLGWNVLIVDFYGCGNSDGYETTIGVKEAIDVKTCFDYVDSTSEQPIILYGVSMGAAAIMKAVSEKNVEPNKIILECPFGNMRSAVAARVSAMGAPTIPFTDLFMFWGGVQNGFWAYDHNPEDYAKEIKVPTLLMYGEKDKRVPRSETDLIFQNLGGEKRLVTFPESGHESYLNKYKTEWTKAVGDFLN